MFSELKSLGDEGELESLCPSEISPAQDLLISQKPVVPTSTGAGLNWDSVWRLTESALSSDSFCEMLQGRESPCI